MLLDLILNTKENSMVPLKYHYLENIWYTLVVKGAQRFKLGTQQACDAGPFYVLVMSHLHFPPSTTFYLVTWGFLPYLRGLRSPPHAWQLAWL